jgi:hypothetical protein
MACWLISWPTHKESPEAVDIPSRLRNDFLDVGAQSLAIHPASLPENRQATMGAWFSEPIFIAKFRQHDPITR